MRYYVIGDDGQKYGPADVATLNGWITEGRLIRTQMLEDEASGSRMAASSVEGLNFPPPAAAAGPSAPAAGPLPGSPGYMGQYARPGGYVPDDGSKDLQKAWIFGGVGLFIGLVSICCGFGFFAAIALAIVGIVMANKAEAKGASGAIGAKIFNIVVLLLAILGLVLVGVLAGRMLSRPEFQKALQQAQQQQLAPPR